MNYLHFFGAGRILRIRQRQHSPDSLRLIYFCAIIFVTFFIIIICIIYYCLRLIGYVLIFGFFCELKFKLKFVRWFFFGGGTGSETVLRGWLGGLLRAGNGATSARDELQTATVVSHSLRAAFLINFQWMLRVAFNRVQFQFQPTFNFNRQRTAHAAEKGRQNSFIKSNSQAGEAKQAGQPRRGRNKLAKSFAWEI